MYMEFYEEVCRRTAQLVAGWQCVGFTHGQSNICRLCTDRHEKWWTVEDAALVHDVPQAVLILLAGSNTEMLYAGVLNTDNMSILGLTIDYGPYGFMDRYMAMP